MKKCRRFLSLALVMALLFTWLDIPAFAEAAASSTADFEYQVDSDGNATITDYHGSATELVIPAEIDGYSVTSIGGYAFSDCSALTDITIPDSVTNIGKWAFYGCSGLTNIIIPDSVISIGDCVFWDCCSLTDITIPDGVTSIGNFAFAECSSLTNITIPDSVTSIGWHAFEYCSSFANITIPDSVTSIGDSAFYKCSSLTNIIISDSVTSIEESTFEGCSSLTNITIPDSVTSIGDRAFYGCSSLTNITIPDGVTSIGDRAFYGCSPLTNITIPDGVTSIGESTFEGCNSLTNITIPDGVTSVGDRAFYDCYSLTNITIPDGVTSIGSSAFSDCSSLTNITIPDSVTSIGEAAFSDCRAFTDITIPNGVTSIENNLFYGCKSLVNVTIPDSVISIGDQAFMSCYYLTNINIPDNVTSIGVRAFYECRRITDITIPDGVESIGVGTFEDCNSLRSITIPDSVTSIGWNAFLHCSSLVDVTIPDSVTSIGSDAFSGCSSLTNITIPDNVTSIGDGAFGGCSSLVDVTIPDSVTSIGNYAFTGCSSLTNITIPDSVTSIGDEAFYNCKRLTIYGIAGSYAEQYANKKGIPFVAIEDVPEEDLPPTLPPENQTGEEIEVVAGNDAHRLFFLTIPENTQDTPIVTVEDSAIADVTVANVKVNPYFSRDDWYSMSGELTVTAKQPGETSITISWNEYKLVYPLTVLKDPVQVEEETFDPDIYRADFLSADGDLPEGIRIYFDMESPSDIFLRQLQHESGFGSTVVAWEALTKSFELIKDPTKYIDFAFEKKDIYSALILDMLESSSYNMATIKKNACLELSESAIDYTILALKQDYNLNISKDTKFTDLTLDELNKVKEKSEDYISKNYPEITKIDGFFEKLDGIFTVSNCLGEYYNYFINGVQVILLSDSMKTVMREMYALCPEDNHDLKSALKDCISIMDSSAEEFLSTLPGKGIQIAGREAFKKLFGEFWGYVKQAANAQFPYLWIILAGFDYGKTVSNMYFSTDDTIEKYNNMWALYDIKQLGKETYYSMMEKHKTSGELEPAQGYLSANDLMFSILNQDCEKAWEFVDVLDETLVNKIGQLFTGSHKNEEVKASIRGIQAIYQQEHDLSQYSWVFFLEEDFPLTGSELYDKYSYLLPENKNGIVKSIEVACPVDVYVYDGESNLVASVVDNQPWCETDDLTVAVEEDEKTLYFYDGADYTVRCAGTDTGDMDITIKEFNEEEKEIRSVCYYDVPLTTDKTYHIVADDKQMEEAVYTLTDETTEQIVNFDSDSLEQETEGAPTYKAQIKSGTVQTEKDIGFEAQLFEKQQAQISAYIPEGHEFVRWEVSDPEVYLEDASSCITSFRMPASDVVITAITQPAEIFSPDQEVVISSDRQYISNIQPGTTVKELLSHLTPADLVVRDIEGNELEPSDTVGTGSTISLANGSSKLTVIIFGDVTGDGIINVMDLSQMQNHILALQQLQGCKKIAGSFGKENIDINSVLKENAAILNLQKIDQSYKIP